MMVEGRKYHIYPDGDVKGLACGQFCIQLETKYHIYPDGELLRVITTAVTLIGGCYFFKKITMAQTWEGPLMQTLVAVTYNNK
jgi:hypothetical protein